MKGFLRFFPRTLQLPLILPAVPGIENRGSIQNRRAEDISFLHRIDQDRQTVAISANKVECDFVDEPLHMQKGGEVRLIEDLASNGQEVLKTLACDEFYALIAGPVKKGLIYFGERAVEQRGDIATRRVLIQILEGFLQQLLVNAPVCLRVICQNL